MISSGSSGQDRWVSLPLYWGCSVASTRAWTTLVIVVGVEHGGQCADFRQRIWDLVTDDVDEQGKRHKQTTTTC